ncbi:hypothetical protein BDV41DRAFT_528775 [Aspergillus transmontanensis]|uniref:Uncharacterized protein n=1 Tax=Aspergillus transmontanensis TaxID=1034304 RepID=A0A5N6WA85_9EURO|nr:hypothetical protein BDV41DRAFT_528775 [Aspergillus transmontanensis]
MYGIRMYSYVCSLYIHHTRYRCLGSGHTLAHDFFFFFFSSPLSVCSLTSPNLSVIQSKNVA